MTWTVPTPDPVTGPQTGPDRPILEAYLAYQRGVLLNICAGLTGDQLAARPIASSDLSLLGLVRHLAWVERTWFRERARGQQLPPMYDPALGMNTDFDDLDPAEAQDAFERLKREWTLADEAVAGMAFGDTFEHRGAAYSLRMIYVHMIAEYSRHNGHADLIREAIDGVQGR
jgi:hypothetical protein